MAFDDRHMEPLALLTLGGCWLGATLGAYNRISARVAAHGVELSDWGHVKVFGLAAVAALVLLLALALAVGIAIWLGGNAVRLTWRR